MATPVGDFQDENGMYLYSKQLLEEVHFSESQKKFNPEISPIQPGANLLMRPLAKTDFHKGYLELLKNLTAVGDVDESTFIARFDEMYRCANTYYVTVIEDLNTGMVVASTTLLIEQKFIHAAALRGRIEDVVVNPDYRGKQLGKLLVETMTCLGKHLGVYKMSLECKDLLINFYSKSGYNKDCGNNFMVLRFKD